MYSLLVATVGAIVIGGLGHPLETIFLSFIGGVEPFILIAVPLFIFAGEILSSGGDRPAHRQLRAGAAGLPARRAGRGDRRVVPDVRRRVGLGDRRHRGDRLAGDPVDAASAATRAASPRRCWRSPGTLALLMPLSIPFLVYAFISGVSMRQLSMAGIVPGAGDGDRADRRLRLVRQEERLRQRRRARRRAREIWAATKDAGPALMMPLIIVGGIWSGVFTPTESAAVAVVYGIAGVAVPLPRHHACATCRGSWSTRSRPAPR